MPDALRCARASRSPYFPDWVSPKRSIRRHRVAQESTDRIFPVRHQCVELKWGRGRRASAIRATSNALTASDELGITR